MAAPEYVTTPVPGCVESTDVNQWLQNINALATAATSQVTGIACRPLVGTVNNDGCISLPYSGTGLDPQSADSSRIDKKIFLSSVTVKASVEQGFQFGGNTTSAFGTQPASGTVFFQVSVKCDGVTLGSTPAWSMPTNTTQNFNLNLIAECPRTSDLEICVDYLGYSQNSNPYLDLEDNIEANITAEFCGAVVCVLEPYNRALSDLAGFCCAPDIEACCVGRAGIQLMQQNLKSLYSYLEGGYYVTECPVVAGAGGALYTLPYDSDYLVIGSATVCADRTGFAAMLDGSVSASMYVECGGDATVCPARNVNFDGTIFGTPELVKCFDVGIVACGSCPAGTVINAGLNTFETCGTTLNPIITNGEVANVVIENEEYTVFTFRKESPFETGQLARYDCQPVGKCIDRDSLLAMVDASDAANEYICSIVDKPVICNRVQGPIGISAALTQTTIRPPAPPPTPLPPNWPPDKKTSVAGNATICFTDNSPSQNFEAGVGQIEVQILCGGAPIKSIITDCQVAPRSYYITDANGNYDVVDNPENLFCKTVDITAVVTCPIDVPLDFAVNVTGFSGDITWTGNYDIAAFCL